MGANFTKTGIGVADQARSQRAFAPGRSIGVEQVPPLPLFDAELGQIFIRIRGICGLGLWDMARRIGTEPTVIANLEAGALDALPEWPEVVAIVEAYAALADIDSQPIIARMLQGYSRQAPQVSAPITTYLPPQDIPESAPPPQKFTDDVQEIVPYDVAEARRRATTVQPVQVPRARRASHQRSAETAVTGADGVADTDEVSSHSFGWLSQRRIWIFAVAAPIFVIAAALLTARMSPRLLYGITAPFPAITGGRITLAIDTLVTVMAPRRDGLVWIDVGDPRVRRRDKVQDWGR